MDSWEIHLEENKSLTLNFVFVNIEVTTVLLFKTNKKTTQKIKPFFKSKYFY